MIELLHQYEKYSYWENNCNEKDKFYIHSGTKQLVISCLLVLYFYYSLEIYGLQQERGIKRSGDSRSSSNTKPSKTLFVINFDPVHTRTRDLESHFDHYGKILNIRIRRNFAFVQFESQEDATKALDATNLRL